MYKALYRNQPVTPIGYFVLSRINSAAKLLPPPDTPELVCSHRTCHAPVHFYGREVAKRKILGMARTSFDTFLRFDHYDGYGEDCPLRSKKKPYITDDALRAKLEAELAENLNAAKLSSGPINFDPHLIGYIFGVWAHMYDGHALTYEKFLEAKKAADIDHLLDLRGLEPWRSAYALALAINFEARDGRTLRLVPEQVVRFPDRARRQQFALEKRLSLAEIEGERTKPARLYVVDTENLTPFSGPHIVSKTKTDAYANKSVNAAWANRLLTTPLQFG